MEVSQQTWLKLIELAKRGRYQPTAPFWTMLYTLARNRWMDEYVRRREAARSVPMDEAQDEVAELPTGATEVGDLLARRESEAALAKAMALLPPEQREVVALWMQGFQLVEVARITGARWHTVVNRKRYALEKLRRQLAPTLQEG